jgi:pilus assembly protein CpaD
VSGLVLGAALAGCAGTAENRGIESIHQPLVQRADYTLDLAAAGGLGPAEQRRLADWFETIDLRYGDRVSIDDPVADRATRETIAAIAAHYGLLVSEVAPVTAGSLTPGTVRVVVSRAIAYVPGCPDWSDKSDTNLTNRTHSNYGCAVNANLAAMVADPEHLIHGARASGETTVLTSSKAITSYRTAPPTGEKGLREVSTEGSK